MILISSLCLRGNSQNFPDLANKFGQSIDIKPRWLKGRRGQVEGDAILQGTMAKDAKAMAAYEERLSERNLPDIPFHMVDKQPSFAKTIHLV